MSNQDTDVQVTVRAIAEGLQDVNSLANEVTALGGDAQEAGVKAESLNGQLQQLASQNTLITQFESARDRTDRLTASMATLQTEVQEAQSDQQRFQQNAGAVTTALDQQRGVTANLSSEIQRLQIQLVEAKTAQTDAVAASKAAGGADEELAQGAATARQQVTDLTTALKARNTEYNEAVRVDRQLEQALASDTQSAAEAKTAIDRLTQTITEQQAVLDQSQAKQSALQASLAEYKISTDDLGGAQQRLAQRLTETQNASIALSSSLKEQVNALQPVQAAYDELGIKSVASLEEAAVRARAAFTTIQESGTAAAGDLDRAFAAVAEAELAVAQAAGEAETKMVVASLEGRAATDAQRASVAALRDQYIETGKGADVARDAFKFAGEAALAFLGIQIGAELIKGLGEVADSAKTVEARLRLATDSQEAFKIAQQGVNDIAKQTGGLLEDTANLYAKVATSVKDTGGAQADALTITKAVSEAMRISGGDSQAAAAGVQQFTQALGAGVLRGQDFKSVIEEVPALAQAIAAGLGITNSQLREFAEQGKLTSDQVLGALERQAGMLDTQFQSVNATLTKSLADLKVAVTETVGEIDKTTDASGGLAEGIETISKAIIAFGQNPAVPLAFSALGGVIKTALGGVEIAVDGIALAFHSAELAVTEASAAIALALSKITFGQTSKDFALAADVLQDRANTLKTQVVKNFTDMGNDTKVVVDGIEQTATKGFQAVSAATADAGDAADKTGPKIQQLGDHYVQAANNAKNAANTFTQDLSPAAQKLVKDFESTGTAAAGAATGVGQAQTAAKSAAPDFKNLFEGFDPKSAQNIRDVVGALNELRAQGKVTAQEYQTGLQQLVKDLSARDLPAFAEAAAAAFGKTDAGIEQLADVMDALRTEALSRLGIDAQETFSGIDAATRTNVASIRTLAQNTQTTALDMQAALSAAVSKATTREDLQAVITSLGNVKVAGFDSAAAVAQLKGMLDAMPNEASKFDPVVAAFKSLGVTSQQELNRAAIAAQQSFQLIQQSGTQSVGVVAEAFAKYADAQLKAAATAGDAQLAQAAASLQSKAATEQQQQALAAVIAQYPQLAAVATATAQTQEQAANQATEAYNKLLQEIEKAGDSDTLTNLRTELRQAFDAGTLGAQDFQAALDATKQKEEQLVQQSQGIAAALGSMVTTASAYYHSLSDEVGKYFDDMSRQIIINGEPVEEYLQSLGALTDNLNKRVAEQTQQANALTSALNAQNGATQLNVLLAQQAADSFKYLDSQTLSQLTSAIATAKQALDQLDASAASTFSDLEDQLDQLNGNTLAVQQRQNDAKRADIQQQLQQAQLAGDGTAVKQLQQSLQLLDQIQQVQTQQFQQQQTTQAPTTSAPAKTIVVQFQSGSQTESATFNDQTSADNFISMLETMQNVSILSR